jgi:hypothetical protein
MLPSRKRPRFPAPPAQREACLPGGRPASLVGATISLSALFGPGLPVGSALIPSLRFLT